MKNLFNIYMNKYGFTLSEVLITLGIIGIIAALTIPIIINNANDAAFNAGAKKALSIANQAYKIAYLENGSGFGPFSDNTQATTKFNALKSQLKVIADCPFTSNATGKCWSNSGVGPKGYAVASCSMMSNAASNQPQNISFTTADGMFWMLYSYSATSGVNWFFVDVNGDKGPNDWAKDVFIFNLNDSDITPQASPCGTLKHNDGSFVSATEFTDPFVK